jgi:hypothetical protein
MQSTPSHNNLYEVYFNIIFPSIYAQIIHHYKSSTLNTGQHANNPPAIKKLT